MADKRNFKKSNSRFKKEKPEFEQQIVDIARVTRVMAGGKRMRFRICLVIGDKKGRVGYGVAKAADVPMAVEKAYRKAQRDMIKVNMRGGTIPHEVRMKRGASKILLKPAPEGTGVIAGGACRIVLDMAGVNNVVAKILGTNNKVSNVSNTIEALKSLRAVKEDKKKVKMSKEEEKVDVKKTVEPENK